MRPVRRWIQDHPILPHVSRKPEKRIIVCVGSRREFNAVVGPWAAEKLKRTVCDDYECYRETMIDLVYVEAD